MRKDCVLNKELGKWKALNMNIFVCDYWVGTECRGQSLECRSEPGSKLRESHSGEKRQKMENSTEEGWLGGQGDLKDFWRATSIRKDFLFGNRVQ